MDKAQFAMKINIDVFNLYDRACKVYRNICDSNNAKYVLVQGIDEKWFDRENVSVEIPLARVQGVDREWIGRENVNVEIPIAHVQVIDSEQLSAATSEIDNVHFLDIEAGKIMEKAGTGIVFANFSVGSWNDELSPWSAEAVFKNQPFSGRAQETLGFVTDVFVPELVKRYGLSADVKVIIGGYSLAGLFSLWAAYRTDIFYAVAAVSPSVWFPGWIEFTQDKHIHADKVYLSLGNREERTNNRVMSRVGDNIRLQKEIFDGQSIQNVLEWNEGNHFRDVEERVAKGFLWTILQ